MPRERKPPKPDPRWMSHHEGGCDLPRDECRCFDKCEHCRKERQDHITANLSDGPFTGETVLICPTSVFTEER